MSVDAQARAAAAPAASFFEIEDAFHCDRLPGSFASFHDALQALKLVSALAFDEPLHRPPCHGWRTCQREWTISEYRIEGAGDVELVAQTHVARSTVAGVQWMLEAGGA